MKQYCFICLPCVHQITVCSNWEVWRALNWGAAVTLSRAMSNAFYCYLQTSHGLQIWAKATIFYVLRIIIVDVVGGTGSGHQGWINYVFKILVCEVWNTLTLKKIVWVSGKWMFFYLRLNICWVRTVTSIKWNSYILWKFTKIAIGCWLKIHVVCQSKFSICRKFSYHSVAGYDSK